MGLFTPRWKIDAQNLVCKMNANRLVISESKLDSAIKLYVSGHKKVIDDCARLVNSTVVPRVFFSRLDTLFERAEKLAKLESIRPELFTKSPSQQMEKIRANIDSTIDAFIMRYWKLVSDTAEKLKSQAAKERKYESFFTSLSQYDGYMKPINKATITRLKNSLPGIEK